MATIIWKGFQKEPKEDWQLAYEFLTGRRKKPIIVEFGKPETLSNQSEDDIEDQGDPGNNEE